MPEYTKTNWQNGDIITAEKLNNIEDGISKIRTFVFEFTVSSNGLGHWRAQTEPGLTAIDLLSAKWIAGPYADSYTSYIPIYYDPTSTIIRLL